MNRVRVLSVTKPCKFCGAQIPDRYDLCSSCYRIYEHQHDEPRVKLQMDYLARKIAVETQQRFYEAQAEAEAPGCARLVIFTLAGFALIALVALYYN